MNKRSLIFFVFVVTSNLLVAQTQIPISLKGLETAPINACFGRVIAPQEYTIQKVKYLAPHPDAPMDSIEKYYDLKLQTYERGGDSIDVEIIPAEYEMYYDTIQLDANNDYRIIGEFKGDTTFEYYEILPSDTILIQCSYCHREFEDFKVTGFCKYMKPAIKVFKSMYLGLNGEIIKSGKLPKYIVNTRINMMKPAYTLRVKTRIRRTQYIEAIPKAKNVPSHLVQEQHYKKWKPIRYHNSGLLFWEWKQILCKDCEQLLKNYGGYTILELEYRMRELGYPFPLTNLIDEKLIQALKEMDIQALKSEKLIDVAKLLTE